MPEETPTLPQAVAENVLTLLCLNVEHGRLVRSLVTAEQFDNEVLRTYATRALAFWQEHDQPPGRTHIADLVADILTDKKNRRAGAFRSVLNGMLMAEHAGINAKYVIDSVKTLQRLSALRHATYEAADLLESRQQLAIGDVERVFDEALRARQLHFDPGLKLTDYPRALKYLEARKEEFITGIRPFDKAGITPARGTVFLFLAPSGFGKTWFLINIGRRAIQDRKKVLHITLELEDDQVLVRYLQSLFAVPRHIGEDRLYSIKLRAKIGEPFGLKRKAIQPAFGLAETTQKKLAGKLNWYGRRVENLLIKKFPMRRLDMNGLVGYLDSLEQIERFVPDLLLLDYFGVIRTDPKDHRISIGREFEEFRAILEERNVAGATASQVNRKGMDARNVRATHTAEDISLINTADIAVTMSATPHEREKGLARLFVSKARSNKDQFGALITQNYNIGQFCVDATQLDSSYWSWLEQTERGRQNADDEEMAEE